MDPPWSLRALSGSLALLCASLIAAAVVVALARHYRDSAVLRYTHTQERLADTRAAIRAAQLQRTWAAEYGPRYRALVAAGLVGAERRLDWAETLRTAAAEIGLTGIDYELAPREALVLPSLHDSGLQVYQSAMSLKLELLHTLDLIRLLDSLEQARLALVMPQACELKRSAAARAEGLPEKPAIEARCRLWWITLDRAAAPAAGDAE